MEGNIDNDVEVQLYQKDLGETGGISESLNLIKRIFHTSAFLRISYSVQRM